MRSRRNSGRVRLLGVLAVLGLLAGCTPGPNTGGTPWASPPPSNSPTPSTTLGTDPSLGATVAPDPLTTVTQLVIRPDSLELRDAADQLVQALDYMGQADEAVAMLSAVFDVPARSVAYAGSNHYPGGVRHSWGDFEVDERHYDEARRVAENLDYLVWPRLAVYVDGPNSHGVDLVTVQGHRAGDDWAVISSDPEFDPGLYTCVGSAIEVLDFASPDGATQAVAVVVTQSGADTVERIGAPEMIADGCA